MSERETNQRLHGYEQRIKELTAALRQVKETANVNFPETALANPWVRDALVTIDRIRVHATAALLHDHIEHGKGWV